MKSPAIHRAFRITLMDEISYFRMASAADDSDLTGPFCTRRFERNCLGKELGSCRRRGFGRR
jgi:hypothetical protein